MNVSRLYHLGQKIAIKLRLENKKEGQQTLQQIPQRVTARVYDSQGNPLTDVIRPQMEENVVILGLEDNVIPDVGDYVALFKIEDEGKSWELPIYFAVASKELIEKTRGMLVAQLEPDSTDDDIEKALSLTIRALRRNIRAVASDSPKEPAKLAYNTAQIYTEKRLEK